jgi:hypothetical protein
VNGTAILSTETDTFDPFAIGNDDLINIGTSGSLEDSSNTFLLFFTFLLFYFFTFFLLFYFFTFLL